MTGCLLYCRIRDFEGDLGIEKRRPKSS